MRVAYMRVSTVEQNLDRQKEALEKYNIDRWYSEKVSGKNVDRSELKKLREFVREGDEVYVLDFSRMSRSVSDLLKIIEEFSNKGVKLISIKENFDTSTPTGKLMLTLIASINEFERTNLLERQREGIELAKERGVYLGRTKKELNNFDEVVELWRTRQITVTKAAELLGISRGTFYNRVNELEITKIHENKR